MEKIEKIHLLKPEKNALLEFKNLLFEKFPHRIKKIILYGSRARGDFSNDSDIDVLIITDKEDWNLVDKISDVSWEIQFKYGFQFFISSMVYSEKAFEEDKDHLFVRNVLHDGIEL